MPRRLCLEKKGSGKEEGRRRCVTGVLRVCGGESEEGPGESWCYPRIIKTYGFRKCGPDMNRNTLRNICFQSFLFFNVFIFHVLTFSHFQFFKIKCSSVHRTFHLSFFVFFFVDVFSFSTFCHVSPCFPMSCRLFFDTFPFSIFSCSSFFHVFPFLSIVFLYNLFHLCFQCFVVSFFFSSHTLCFFLFCGVIMRCACNLMKTQDGTEKRSELNKKRREDKFIFKKGTSTHTTTKPTGHQLCQRRRTSAPALPL